MKTKPEHISQEDWDDADIPELTDDEFARMRPASEVLYELLPKEAAAAMLQPQNMLKAKSSRGNFKKSCNFAVI